MNNSMKGIGQRRTGPQLFFFFFSFLSPDVGILATIAIGLLIRALNIQ